MGKFYTRDGKEFNDIRVWAINFEKEDRRVKQQTLKNGFFVSTVFLGIDYNYTSIGKPLIFETMVFYGDKSYLDCKHYSTEEEAIEGHKKMVQRWKNKTFQNKDFEE